MLLAPLAFPRLAATDTAAQQQLTASIQAMGGQALLPSVHGAAFKARAQHNLLEQSIHPEDPWWVDRYSIAVTLDFAKQRAWIREQLPLPVPSLAIDLPASPSLEYVVADGEAAARAEGKFVPASQGHVQATRGRIVPACASTSLAASNTDVFSVLPRLLEFALA